MVLENCEVNLIPFTQEEMDRLLDALYDTTDCGPVDARWKSRELRLFVAGIEEKFGVPESDRIKTLIIG